MERLTKKIDDKNHWFSNDRLSLIVATQEAVNKLAEYENTGLEPSEIKKLKSYQDYKFEMPCKNATILGYSFEDISDLINNLGKRMNENLSKENEELKQNQNKVAVEKLEIIEMWVEDIIENNGHTPLLLLHNVRGLIAELKEVSNET